MDAGLHGFLLRCGVGAGRFAERMSASETLYSKAEGLCARHLSKTRALGSFALCESWEGTGYCRPGEDPFTELTQRTPSWFKQLRSEADLGDSCFALGSWQQPTPAAWDGFARVSRSGVGVVVVFRNESGLFSAHVKLPLLPEGTYTVRSAMTHKDLAKIANSEWAEGVDVKFPEGEKVEILEIREIKKTSRLGKP